MGAVPRTENSSELILTKLAMDIPIRVLLDEKNVTKPFQWKLESPGFFVVFSPGENRRKTIVKAPTVVITHSKGSFYVNGLRQLSSHFFIVPLKDSITFGKNSFDGIFAVTKVNDNSYLVNHLDLEDYVLSVIPYESQLGWPDEVQKAFCISFRSYGISKVLEQRALHARTGKLVPFDIKNTNAHQVYRGNLKSVPYKKNVEDTRGVVLVHDKKPVLAMFDICCGGVIPAKKKGIDFSKAPYLKRPYACEFCKNYKFYQWQHQFSFEKIEKELKKEFPTMGALRDIKVSARDDAGVALEIKFRSANKWFTMTAAKFKSLFKELRSHYYTFTKSGRNLVIDGRGYGHLWGLCQRGTVEMVSQGWNCKNILKFYYPQATFMRLKKKASL